MKTSSIAKNSPLSVKFCRAASKRVNTALFLPITLIWLTCFFICISPANAQLSFDPVSTFVPIGNGHDKNEHLARTLKNEQELKFRTRVLARRGVVLVEFSLPTCPACDPSSKAIIELLSKFGGKADYVRLDLNKNLGLSYKYDVPEVPAVLLFRDGQLEDRFVTFDSSQKNKLARSLSRLLSEPTGNDQSHVANKYPKLKNLIY